jgi:hypothetical protein
MWALSISPQHWREKKVETESVRTYEHSLLSAVAWLVLRVVKLLSQYEIHPWNGFVECPLEDKPGPSRDEGGERERERDRRQIDRQTDRV